MPFQSVRPSRLLYLAPPALLAVGYLAPLRVVGGVAALACLALWWLESHA